MAGAPSISLRGLKMTSSRHFSRPLAHSTDGSSCCPRSGAHARRTRASHERDSAHPHGGRAGRTRVTRDRVLRWSWQPPVQVLLFRYFFLLLYHHFVTLVAAWHVCLETPYPKFRTRIRDSRNATASAISAARPSQSWVRPSLPVRKIDLKTSCDHKEATNDRSSGTD